MRFLMAVVCSLFLTHKLVGEQSPESVLSATKWAYADSRGRFEELIFGANGVLNVRYVKTTYRKYPNDPYGWGYTVYELKSEATGRWVEENGIVRLKMEDPNSWDASGKHPVDTYSGRFQAGTFNGIANSKMDGGWSWTATAIRSDAEQENRMPRVLVADKPAYPRIKTLFTEKKVNGSATVKIQIAATGDVSDVAVLSATKKEFGESAKQAVKVWQFLPRVREGKAVEATVEMKINFTVSN